ncbi:hypothetical protein P167DRAFT_576007 [Morchella conica CCBAS932]|uniref:Uncharacterized protein n=1 Tax=Morchella conica CCBAS932 TaxID=1392247 RepID=A0A3N4KMT1_9PEZI|nr:hypothetical protein P167DRAFT_576007 [Morchella conica CCBAS932]
MASEARLQPTSITIIIVGHIFTIPNDPLEAFHPTRTQTIASFRAVAAGTATATDISFIFSAAIAPDTTASTSYFCPALPGSGSAERTPIMTQLVPARYSGGTREIKIDNHTFILPTDAVYVFLATREMTIAASRKVLVGPAAAGSGSDMAFVFGTAIIATRDKTRNVDTESVTKRQARLAGGEGTTVLIAHDTEEIEDDQDDCDEEDNYATLTAASQGGFSPRSWKDLTLTVPFLSQCLFRRVVRDTREAATDSTPCTPTPIITPVPTLATNTADSSQKYPTGPHSYYFSATLHCRPRAKDLPRYLL